MSRSSLEKGTTNYSHRDVEKHTLVLWLCISVFISLKSHKSWCQWNGSDKEAAVCVLFSSKDSLKTVFDGFDVRMVLCCIVVLTWFYVEVSWEHISGVYLCLCVWFWGSPIPRMDMRMWCECVKRSLGDAAWLYSSCVLLIKDTAELCLSPHIGR